MQAKSNFWKKCADEHKCPERVQARAYTPCVNNFSGEYQCSNIDLMAFIPLAELGTTGDANDMWGWTDPVSGKEIAIAGLVDGTSFIDISDPRQPVVLGVLPTHTGKSSWRDIKVYKDHAFIVADNNGNHGMQVFDLTQLTNAEGLKGAYNGNVRKITDHKHNKTYSIVEFKETAHYGEHGSSHNIVINEATGFAYSVGSNTCSAGLHVINLKDPKEPTFVGCFSQDGYTHDAQCVVYKGPDTRYTGKEICFAYNEDTLTIVDVEDKANMKLIARQSYTGYAYTHQGWLFDGESHLLLNDELDEMYGLTPEDKTRSMVWDVSKLDEPKLTGSYYSTEPVIDHNEYIAGKLAFQSNYCAGLRILDVSQGTQTPPVVTETAYFDVAPDYQDPVFKGSWSNYPYFASGNIPVSSIERGFFLLAPHPQVMKLRGY